MTSSAWSVRAPVVGLRVASLILAATMTPSAVAAQSPAALVVTIEGQAPLKLSMEDLKRLPVHGVEAEDVGERTRYEGALVADILRKAGMTFGQSLRGDRLQYYLLVESSDGYRVVYALPEIDAQFTDDLTILAYQRGGAPMPANDGALRLVHGGDKRHARWARHVTALTVKRSQ